MPPGSRIKSGMSRTRSFGRAHLGASTISIWRPSMRGCCSTFAVSATSDLGRMRAWWRARTGRPRRARRTSTFPLSLFGFGAVAKEKAPDLPAGIRTFLRVSGPHGNRATIQFRNETWYNRVPLRKAPVSVRVKEGGGDAGVESRPPSLRGAKRRGNPAGLPRPCWIASLRSQ